MNYSTSDEANKRAEAEELAQADRRQRTKARKQGVKKRPSNASPNRDVSRPFDREVHPK